MITENAESPRETLLEKPAVTILIDGLVYTAYDKAKQIFQTGIHTTGGGDWLRLAVEVRADNEPGPLFPSASLPWNPSHQTIHESAPFWLYVDSGNGRAPDADASASLHELKNLGDAKSFGHLLNFEDLYDRPLKLNPSLVAQINIPHGTCYSAEKSELKLLHFDQEAEPSEATEVETRVMSTLCAVDIPHSVSGGRSIVLANEKQEFFRFPLDPDRHYEITLMNIPPESFAPDTRLYFLKYYELFKLNSGEKKFLVAPLDHVFPKVPPCLVPSGDLEGGLDFSLKEIPAVG